MDINQQPAQGKEWACRILLSVLTLRIGSGYIAVLQTHYELVSPLIPATTIKVLAYDTLYFYWKPCLFATAALLVSIWFYFFGRKKLTIILAAAAIAGFEIWIRYFII